MKTSFFFDKLEKFKFSFAHHTQELDRSGRLIKKQRVRIAILDTGIDKRKGGIRGGFFNGRLRDDLCYSWVGGSVHDENGHGTNTTNLLLNVALDAEICVAKVFAGNDFGTQEARNVADVCASCIFNLLQCHF